MPIMKIRFTIKNIILLVCLLGFPSLKSQNKVEFEINASALFNDEATIDYSIIVYEDGTKKDSIFVKKTKGIKLTLASNKVYSIVYKKQDCADKLVIVNTELPLNFEEETQDPFELQIELSAKNKKINREYADYPVAVLIVNKTKRLLMASESYYKLTHL